MTEVVSVKFKNRGKSYYFDPGALPVEAGADVVVETAKGLEMGCCEGGVHKVPDECVVQPLRPIVRIATESDRRVAEINKRREKEAFTICRQKIVEHGLDMKLVDVECSFEGNKTTFFFTSDGRVDFRELVKDLAGVFRNRIELRQIGVRDEAKMLGGIGICGRPFCCSRFLDDFQPVSTKMAKVQSMSLNPAKISGSCGRLMCCLRYEEKAYEELVKEVPKNGTYVETTSGYGSVCQTNLLRRSVKVRLDGEGEDVYKVFGIDDIAVIPGGRPRPGETPPQILKTRPKPVAVPEPEPAEDLWKAPSMIYEATPAVTPAAPAQETAEVPVRRKSQNRRGRGKGGEPRPQQAAQPQKAEPKQPQQPKTKQPQKPRDPAEAPRAQSSGRSGYRHRRGGGGKPRPPKTEG